MSQIFHVISAIGIPARYAKGIIRKSFGKNNTESEAEEIAETLIDMFLKSIRNKHGV